MLYNLVYDNYNDDDHAKICQQSFQSAIVEYRCWVTLYTFCCVVMG